MPKGYSKAEYPHMYASDSKGVGDDPPPSFTTKASTSTTTTTKKPGGRKPNIYESTSQLCTAVGTGLVSAGTIRNDPKLTFDGAVFIANAPKVGEAFHDLAERNPQIKAMLEKAFTAGAWGSMFAAIGGIAIPIAANHKLIPPMVAAPFIPEGVVMPSDATIEAMRRAQADMADTLGSFGNGMTNGTAP